MLDTYIPPMTWDWFSEDRTYRYGLGMRWSEEPLAAFICLNPSKATKKDTDASWRRMIGYARTWGNGGVAVGNVFGLVSTDPSVLHGHPRPVGPDNDMALMALMGAAYGVIVCGWGPTAGQVDPEREKRVLEIIRSSGRVPMCLTTTADGSPGHPLRLRRDLVPVPYTGRGA